MLSGALAGNAGGLGASQFKCCGAGLLMRLVPPTLWELLVIILPSGPRVVGQEAPAHLATCTAGILPGLGVTGTGLSRTFRGETKTYMCWLSFVYF